MGRRDSSRARDILTCSPLEFFGSKPAEDPHEFVRQIQRTLRLIGASEIESIEMASYRLHDVAANWCESWKMSRGEGAPSTVWGEFTKAFLAYFLPPEVSVKIAGQSSQGVQLGVRFVGQICAYVCC